VAEFWLGTSGEGWTDGPQHRMKINHWISATAPPGPVPVRRQQRNERVRALTCGALAAAILAAVLVAGCGGSSSSGGATRVNSYLSIALSYSQCMRSHGVPDFPDANRQGYLVARRRSSGRRRSAERLPRLLEADPPPRPVDDAHRDHLLPRGRATWRPTGRPARAGSHRYGVVVVVAAWRYTPWILLAACASWVRSLVLAAWAAGASHRESGPSWCCGCGDPTVRGSPRSASPPRRCLGGRDRLRGPHRSPEVLDARVQRLVTPSGVVLGALPLACTGSSFRGKAGSPGRRFRNLVPADAPAVSSGDPWANLRAARSVAAPTRKSVARIGGE
jgi:hypothetical protein